MALSKNPSHNSTNLNELRGSVTAQINRLRQAGLSDKEIDIVLAQNKNKSNMSSMDEHNKRVDETVDNMVWQEKLGVFALIATLLLFGYVTFSDSISGDTVGNIVVGWVVGIWILVIVGNIKSLPVYIRNLRFFFKKL